MTDRELLELAAKAAGHEVEYDEASGLFWYDNIYTGLLWNPLDIDGDALRLAVKLNLIIEIDVRSFTVPKTEIPNRTVRESNFPYVVGVMETHGDDPYAATRRAIVRAAAKIGKGME
jgi:hypothetical protein